MTSHGSDAGDEIERLRKSVQERDACINILLERAFEARSARDQSVPSVSQGTGCTNARHAEAEATIASLDGKLGASQAAFATSERSFRNAQATIASLEEKLGASQAALATSETMFRARQATPVQTDEDCEVLRTQRRSAIGTIVGVVDIAKSSLDRAEGKDMPFMGNSYCLQTSMQRIHAMGREFLQQADRVPRSEAHAVQAPSSAAILYEKPVFGLEATNAQAIPQPPAHTLAARLDQMTVFGAQATTAPMAQRSLFARNPPSLNPFLRSSGINVPDQGKKGAPGSPIKLSMPDTGRNKAKRMSTEDISPDNPKRVATGISAPVVEKSPHISIFSDIIAPLLNVRDARRLANVDEEPEVSEEEDLYNVSDNESSKPDR